MLLYSVDKLKLFAIKHALNALGVIIIKEFYNLSYFESTRIE